jgi:predicted acetyltransferase
MVPQTTLWWVSGDAYLGRVDIRPSARHRGHATAVLAAALLVVRGLGIDPALFTCDQDNIGVIEANGGVLADQRSGRLRYWVATSSR